MKKGSGMIAKTTVMALTYICIALSVQIAQATPHSGQSKKVVIIGGTTLNCGSTSANQVRNGGCFPVSGAAGELGDFTFAAMAPSAVSDASLASYDTALLNVASYGMNCNMNNLAASQKTALINFVAAGKKLIIYDSECSTQNYSWLPYPFTTANPGAMGAQGILTIVEENFLSSNIPSNPHYINAAYLGSSTDAVGDMNVMTTFDPYWCVDMSGTNVLHTTGPVHTYAKYPAGTDKGLIIYNGLDMDYLYGTSEANLRKIWVQELQQPFNPSNLPCGVTVVGITLSPPSASNVVGGSHTVTAALADLLKNPQPNVLVTFTIKAGPNAGASGTCSPNVNCVSDSSGNVNFTYSSNGTLGTDQIEACFTDNTGTVRCSQVVTKEWVQPFAVCDINGDGKMNILDIKLILAGRGTVNPLLDIDGDGIVTVNDARKCTLQCDNPLCAQ